MKVVGDIIKVVVIGVNCIIRIVQIVVLILISIAVIELITTICIIKTIGGINARGGDEIITRMRGVVGVE